MQLVVKTLARLTFHLLRVGLVPLETVNARAYMSVFGPILRYYGLVLNGRPRYISSTVRFDNLQLITLGERVVISKYVILLTHDYSVTTGLFAIGAGPATDIAVRRPITIGQNVFIGMGAIVLPGTVIGDNVIIGAGSVVRGEIPSDSVVLGNPGRVISTVSSRAARWRELAASDYAVQDAR